VQATSVHLGSQTIHCGFLIANEVWKTMPHNPDVEPRHLPFVFQRIIMRACTVLMRTGKLWWKLQPRRWLCLEHHVRKETIKPCRVPDCQRELPGLLRTITMAWGRA
jgi:hypothetical protein